jgi:peptidoglycan/xylan/chitin deacetylase (PgdA/CDA1 family)
MERQFRWLSRAATVVPLDQALQAVAEGRPLPPRAVAITFDDGYADTLTLAVPLLQRWRLPATFFLVPGILSGAVEPWWEVTGWAFARTSRSEVTWENTQHPLESSAQRRAAYDQVAERLKRRNTARRDQAVAELLEMLRPTGASPVRQLFHDWNGACDLVRAGFGIGSHSCHHAILSQETPQEQQRDLAESRAALEQELQVPIDVLAYPNGTELDFDATTEQAATAAGYSFAVTTLDGFNRTLSQRHQVRRSVIYPERGPIDLVASLANSVRTPGN